MLACEPDEDRGRPTEALAGVFKARICIFVEGLQRAGRLCRHRTAGPRTGAPDANTARACALSLIWLM